jgi:hypothetical protein
VRASRPQIVVINKSNGLVADAALLKMVAAVQRQVSIDFARAWGIDANISMLRAGNRQAPNPAAWWVVVLQHADQADALGYHDLTPQGRPLAKIFAEDVLEAGDQVSVTLSHEVLEMLADPKLNGFEHRLEDGLLYAREVCDPCESDEHGYRINGILVSDFVTPAYFHEGSAGPFDHRRAIRAPFEILPGGYLPALNPETGSWVDLGVAVKPGTRLERRLHALSDQPASSASEVAAPLPAPPRAKVKEPLRRPTQAPKPKPAAKPIKVPLRQPQRGLLSPDSPLGKTPLRQPNRRGLAHDPAAALALVESVLADEEDGELDDAPSLASPGSPADASPAAGAAAPSNPPAGAPPAAQQ